MVSRFLVTKPRFNEISMSSEEKGIIKTEHPPPRK